jgi:hypothetical protein
MESLIPMRRMIATENETEFTPISLKVINFFLLNKYFMNV